MIHRLCWFVLFAVLVSVVNGQTEKVNIVISINFGN